LPDQGGLVANIHAGVSREMLTDAGYAPFDYRNTNREIYLRHNPQAADHEVLLLFSDAPFITGDDITRFIDTSDRTADYVVGLADADSLFRAEQDVDQEICCSELKTALFPFDSTYSRGNNLFMGKLLRVPSDIWNLAQRIYDNRHLLKPKVKTAEGEEGENPDRWKNIIRLFWDYTRSNSNKAAVLRGFTDGLFRFGMFYLSRRREMILPRLFL
jgi:hypothetical protein